MAKESLSYILSRFLGSIDRDEKVDNSIPLLESILGIYRSVTQNASLPTQVHTFMLDDDSTSSIIEFLKNILNSQGITDMSRLNSPLSYLLDELICNIQQHTHTDNGYAFINYDLATKCIEIIIADTGITIYGSYVSAQKYLDLIGNSDASALSLAQDGYSTKNLPDAENRGYGISSNIRMVVEGLLGEFAVLSGNALLVHLADNKKILSLPQEIDFKGTMVIVRFPATVPDNFNLYNYTN